MESILPRFFVFVSPVVVDVINWSSYKRACVTVISGFVQNSIAQTLECYPRRAHYTIFAGKDVAQPRFLVNSMVKS